MQLYNVRNMLHYDHFMGEVVRADKDPCYQLISMHVTISDIRMIKVQAFASEHINM